MAINKETITGLMETIKNLYLSDDIPWMIGYSGGKDSTAALQLVWMSIEGLPIEQQKKNDLCNEYRYSGGVTSCVKMG